MPEKLYKVLLVAIITAAAAAVPAFLFFAKADNWLEVDFLDVGQGDAILIKSPYGQNILIDGGPDGAVIGRLAENLEFWDRTIDLMILTHPHSDHVKGLIEVINQYDVKKILYTGASHSAPDYLAWLDLIREKKIPLVIIDRPQTVKLGEDCELRIIYPIKNLAGGTSGNLNNTSIAAKLVYRQAKFLFAGDMETEAERELIASGADLSADVLKAGHHGSDTSSGEEFISAVKPSIAVIEAGKDNDFGHPSLRTIKRLERAGAKLFRTDVGGTVKIISDGVEITVD